MAPIPDMMTVSKPQLARLGLDQQPLFDLGLRQVRGYAYELWTDHNVHDPGITTLEVLCYALTDLCYRACYPIEDLLAAERADQANMAQQFYTVRQALPSAPVTELDYRKLLIDVKGIRNAWIYPVEAPPYYADAIEGELRAIDSGEPGVRPVDVRGLYGALIEYSRDDAPAAEKNRILAAARAALQAHRNLCEDFVEALVVPTQAFRVCAEIDIEPRADPTDTYARILLAVHRYLTPGVPRHTRAEMLRRTRADGTGWTTPELFEGPDLEGGFIDDDELAAAKLRTKILLSDVIALVMHVDGVVAVRDVVIRPADAEDADAAKDESKWEISVVDGMRSVLAPEACRMVLYKGAMPLVPGPEALARYKVLHDEDEQKFVSLPRDDPSIPTGRFRAAGQYESVQAHFPAVYGIGPNPLPPDAGIGREALARQFEGYLLFFDQLLANASAQLGEVRQLFSRDMGVARTYFFGGVDPPASGLYKANAASVELERPVDALTRRNRFLDHLLARLAERLSDDLQVQTAYFNASAATVARAKCSFLDAWPELGRDRDLAFDYTADPASIQQARNVSRLERRLVHLLGLGAITPEIYVEPDANEVSKYGWRLWSRSGDGTVLLKGPALFDTHERAEDAANVALAAAAVPVGYQRRSAGAGQFTFDVIDGAGTVIAQRVDPEKSAALRDGAIDDLIDVIARHRRQRMCVIENILLRPRPGAEDTFLPICADPGCGEGCPGDDPYSYRLHIVLPGEGDHFAKMEFRRYAEQLIREETPAHLLPKICWVSEVDMKAVEEAWLAWREILAGIDETGVDAKLEALADALFNVKNVYPEMTLGDCAGEDKFVLGWSVLGSEPPPPQ